MAYGATQLSTPRPSRLDSSECRDHFPLAGGTTQGVIGGDPSIELDPVPEAVRAARRFLRAALPGPDLDPVAIDSLVLAASELVTNAVLHARTRFRVTVRRPGPGTIRVEVADGDPRLPQSLAPPPAATSGRGLAIIDGLGLDWGVETHERGKVVWIEAPT
jgi:anti-sigma regulatory factor (Ser/Thr protein kinase)